MDLHKLKPKKGSVKNRKRIARGQGSGFAGTASRGHKGAKSRSGFKNKRAFEGGQMPMQMRLPKRGFKNFNRVSYVPINLDRLQEIAQRYHLNEINIDNLVANGIVRKNDKVKILGAGEVNSSLTVTAHAFSASAKQAIEEKGGSVNIL